MAAIRLKELAPKAKVIIVEKVDIVRSERLDVRSGNIHFVRAPTVTVSTGGAAGIYRPNNPAGAHHTMWYCPFNVGTGYAIGIQVGDVVLLPNTS